MIPATAAGKFFIGRIDAILASGSSVSTSTHPSLELALDLSADVAVGDLTAPVGTLLVSRQSQLHLCPRSFEIDPGWNQGQTFLRSFPDQALDLLLVQEQLPRPLGGVG